MVMGLPHGSAEIPSCNVYSVKGKGLLLLTQTLRAPNFWNSEGALWMILSKGSYLMLLKTLLSSWSAKHRRADAGQERHKLFLVCKVKISPR